MEPKCNSSGTAGNIYPRVDNVHRHPSYLPWSYRCAPLMEGSQRAPHIARMLPKPHHTLALPPSENHTLTSEEIMSKFDTVFDRQITIMEGEKFHIYLTENAQPFCVTTPWAVPFAYRDKLKAELDLLQSQGISHWAHRVVCTNCRYSKKGHQRNPNVCWPISIE